MAPSLFNDNRDASSSHSRRCLFILGSGRCGTSAMAGLVNLLGVYMGKSFLPGNPGNPRGYWEHLDTYQLHHSLRDIMGLHWDYVSPLPNEWWRTKSSRDIQERLVGSLTRDFGGSALWAVKENRLCRYIKLWEPIFSRLDLSPSFLIMFRHPSEVAASFDRKEGLSFNKSLILWLLRNLDVERDTRPYARVFVSFDSLLLDWQQTISQISDRLALQWPRGLRDAEHEIDEFLEPRMRHHAESKTPSSPEQKPPQLFLDIYDALKALEAKDVHIEDTFDTARKTIETQTAFPYAQSLIELIQDLDAANRSMRGSRSWRITYPLRKLYDTVRRVGS